MGPQIRRIRKRKDDTERVGDQELVLMEMMGTWSRLREGDVVGMMADYKMNLDAPRAAAGSAVNGQRGRRNHEASEQERSGHGNRRTKTNDAML